MRAYYRLSTFAKEGVGLAPHPLSRIPLLVEDSHHNIHEIAEGAEDPTLPLVCGCNIRAQRLDRAPILIIQFLGAIITIFHLLSFRH
jgi:hypothetical protein